MKVAIVGGGPSGLYLGLLLKRRRPDWRVEAVEQNRPDDTFGFGVVLADTGLAHLREADEESYAALYAAMRFNDRQIIVQRETPIEYELNVRGGAISRVVLLRILTEQAEKAGVGVHFGRRLPSTDALAEFGLDDADVVVGADGVNSAVRREYAAGFGAAERFLTNHFAWYGTKKIFECPALVFRQYGGGCFVAHYYPYCDDKSTFVAECDDGTWKRLDLGARTDDERRKLFEEIYARELGGHSLIANNSVWRQFPVVRNARWSHGPRVLIGDALASAHFSIGSGTRIAMNDSIALANALVDCGGDVLAGLKSYESENRPRKAKLLDASERSFDWYERMADWMEAYSPEEFVYRFMTRTGRVDDSRLRAQFPGLMSRIDPRGRLR